ncbi:transmembrane 9 superfamily member [Haematococcus lacustris]|uniref:Transmembrane 9 superfamily member n=1 Tax=Haematococcus lacustris TaxID=44745 RepID=A0A699ZK49_HAELA|nr:transmembrane 9 superfamily member [Haematococcus lacustris]
MRDGKLVESSGACQEGPMRGMAGLAVPAKQRRAPGGVWPQAPWGPCQWACTLASWPCEISVLCTYVQLCAEDYQWWWSSFRRGGSVAIYFAIYALGFLLSTLATLDGFLPVLIYVCYMTIAVTSTYFAMGMVGFTSSWAFVHAIFGAIKSD